MNILFLSAHVPSPVGRQAGLKSSYYICEWLAHRGHSLHLICFATEEEKRNCRPEDNRIFRSWDAVDITGWSRLGGITAEWRNPLSVAARSNSRFRRKLRCLLQSHQFDVAVLDHTSMFQYTSELTAVPVLVGSAHDVLSQMWQRKSRQQSRAVLQWLFEREYSRIQKWEKSALGKLDVIAPHSEKDGELLREMNPSACICPIRAWFTCPQHVSSSSRKEVGSIVFLGAFDRSENRDAAEYAIRDILPLIRRQDMKFKFYIVGNHSGRMKQLAAPFPDIVVTGFVSDLPGLLSRMQIALVPLRLGAGIKVKMLECMASGLAVVTTSVGEEGVGGEDGVQYLVGETAEELANCTVRLLKDSIATQAMGHSAREFVINEFNFEKALLRLWSLVEHQVEVSAPVVQLSR
jgi:polysaccharide biosynthesis protein PslH